MSDTKVRSLVEEILASVEQFGMEKTAQALVEHRNIHALVNNDDAKAIVKMVARIFKITEREILFGKGRKNERRDAIAFCAYYLHYILDYKMEMVEHMVNKTRWVLYKYAKRIKNLRPGCIPDKKLLTWKLLFDAELKRSGILKQ